MHKKIIAATIASAVTLAGCASAPKDIPAQSVSTLQYENYTCTQVGMEGERISTRVNELYHSLKKKADDDAMQMGVGLILFWPTLFLLEGGDGPEAMEYGRLKGEHAALERVAIQKECSAIAKLKTPEEFAAEAKKAKPNEG
jgi:hypothetical protein